MIRWIKFVPQFDGKNYAEGFCVENDDKPLDGFCTGTSLYEVDTGDTYFFDEDSGDWINPEAPASQS